MEAMSGISLAKFRDKQLEALLSRELPKGWDVMEYEDREPCVFSLPEVYLLWHTDLDRFLQMKMAKSSKRKDTLSAHVDDVLWYIGRYYDAAFQRETENFIERVIETLYEQLDEWKVELDKVTFQDKQLAFEIDNILRNLFLLRRKLYKFISYNKYWLKDTSYGALSEKFVVTDSITEKQEQKKLTRRDEKKQYHQKLLDAAEILKETFQLSEISALKRYVSAKTLKVFFIDEKRYGKIFRECKELDTIYKKIFCGTQKIWFNHKTCGMSNPIV